MTTTSCTQCGSPLAPGARFCIDCGAAAAATCPSCGTPSSGGRFCAACGTALEVPNGLPGPVIEAATGGAPVTAALPVAERRIVSLLFADLVGFTTISESRDPEEVRELLSAYFDRSRAVVERYGGTVEKFIGDAVFAVWGVPVAREDDAERAVRAGLDLTSAVTALGEELGIDELAMRVGITTGQVAVTLGAVGEGMVAGDAVNTAARVQSVALPGQVWVDDTTRSLTTASLAYTPTGSFELKGKAVPVALFHAVRTTGNVGGDQRVDGLEASFVGRDRDLRMVKELFHATVEERRPRLLLIAGEPGIGKTRLAWEFEKYLDAIPTLTTYWMRTRCLSYGEGVAGRTVAELIRYLLRLTDSDDDNAARAALDRRLTDAVSDPDQREVLRPRLESLLGLTDRSFERADLFACWRAFLESLVVDGESVTLVIDDLQWAEDGLLDFLDHILEAAQSPIFVLALARPEITEARSGVGTGRRSTTLFLDPLRGAAMSTLLDGLVTSLSPQLRDELVRRAEGVPLYAVETVRALIDRDIVVPSEGQYRVDAAAADRLDLDALGPPASLQALLAARLDALAEDERRVVQDASVLGLTFTLEGLRALAPAGADLDTALAGLRHKEILTVEADPRSPERGRFRFVQALLRTVAYDTLSRRDRQHRHLAAAAHLAAQPDTDSMAAVLAEHYLDAITAMPDAPEAAAALSNAQQLLEQAAEHARAVGSPRSAIAIYDRLLDLSPCDEVVIRATEERIELARRLGQPVEEIMRRASVAIEVAQRAGRDDDVLRLRCSRGTTMASLGSATDALAELREVSAACLGRPERVHTLAAAMNSIGICAQSLADPEIARDAAQVALDDIERFGSDSDFAIYLQAMSLHSSVAGYRRLSAFMRRGVLPLFDDRDYRGVAALQNFAASIVNDRPQEAWDAALEGTRRAVAFGLLSAASHGHVVTIATVLATPDAVREARQHIAQVRERGQSSSWDWEAFVAAGSAVLAWQQGEPELVLPAVEVAETGIDPVGRSWWHMREAGAASLNGDATIAGEHAAVAVELMSELGLSHEDMPPCFSFAVDLLLSAGMTDRLRELSTRLDTLSMGQRYALLHGSLQRALALLAEDPAPGLGAAIDIFDGMGAAFHAAVARIDLAHHLATAGDTSGVAALLDAAEGPLQAIGARPALARIAAIREQADAVSVG